MNRDSFMCATPYRDHFPQMAAGNGLCFNANPGRNLSI